MNRNLSPAAKGALYVAKAAIIAAAYAALTLAVSQFGFGPIQFRISEALIVLAPMTSAAIPGLTIGCLLANIISPYGWADLVFGTAATLLAAAFAWLVRKVTIKKCPWLSPLGAVVFNAFMVPIAITVFAPSEIGYWACALDIGLCQLFSCYVLGIPLWILLHATKAEKLIKDPWEK